MPYPVPADVKAAARRGLEYRRERLKSTKRPGGTAVGVRRAQQLSSGSIDFAGIIRMKAFFDRFQYLKQHPDWGKKTMPGYVAWLLWGGDPGYRWAKKVLTEEERRGNPMADLDLDVDVPEKVANVLRRAADQFYGSASELASAWGDPDAGKVWDKIAALFEKTADKVEDLVDKYV